MWKRGAGKAKAEFRGVAMGASELLLGTYSTYNNNNTQIK